jgi:thiamine-phosphate pyrophosphorylase
MMEDDDDLALDPGFADRFDAGARAPCQLYLISPSSIGDDFADTLAKALEGGPVAAFQLRLKGASDAEILAAAERLMPVCAAHEVAFIVNDRMDLAKACGADGVHLGQGDGDPREARARHGAGARICVTSDHSPQTAMVPG